MFFWAPVEEEFLNFMSFYFLFFPILKFTARVGKTPDLGIAALFVGGASLFAQEGPGATADGERGLWNYSYLLNFKSKALDGFK